MKDGVEIKRNSQSHLLKIDSVKKEDKGMYQCFIRNDQESAQATAELRMGGRFDPPEFVSTFTERVMTPGPFVSLACVAKGDPAPEFEWFVYGKKIDQGGNGASPIRIGTHTSNNGDVTSHLNITSARTKVSILYANKIETSI